MSDATASREQRKKMKSFRTKVAQVTGSVIAASAIAIVGLTGLAQPAQAAGGVNVDQHCRTTPTAGAARSVPRTACGSTSERTSDTPAYSSTGTALVHTCSTATPPAHTTGAAPSSQRPATLPVPGQGSGPANFLVYFNNQPTIIKRLPIANNQTYSPD